MLLLEISQTVIIGLCKFINETLETAVHQVVSGRFKSVLVCNDERSDYLHNVICWESTSYRAFALFVSSFVNEIMEVENVFLGKFWENYLSWNIRVSIYFSYNYILSVY